MNVNNNFQLTGRLTQDPKVFDNADGSRKVRFTLAVKDNFQSKQADGTMVRGSQFIPVEVFRSAEQVQKSGLGVYGLAHKGDLVTVTGQMQNNNYTGSDGVEHYEVVNRVENVELMESKSVTDARREDRAAGGSGAPDGE